LSFFVKISLKVNFDYYLLDVTGTLGCGREVIAWPMVADVNIGFNQRVMAVDAAKNHLRL